MHLTTRTAALAASLLLGAACGGDSNGTTPGDGDSDACLGRSCGEDDGTGTGETDTDEPQACSEPADCTEGLLCDPVLGRCVPPCDDDSDCGATELCGDASLCVSRAACVSDADCGAAELCDLCVDVCRPATGATRCDFDANCGFDEFCDTCAGECRPRLGLCEPCVDDVQCGDVADNCLDFAAGGRFCGRTCGAGQASCPVGYTCNEAAAQCVPLSGDCDQVRGCGTPADCPAGQTCSPSFICVPGCTGDEACPGGQVCSAGACVAPCTGAADCPDGAECVEGRCRVPGGCMTSADCTEAETYCDRESMQCVAGCQVNDDCMDGALECIGGDCVPRGCRGNYSCAFGQECVQESGQCVEAEGPHCDTCDASDVNSCGDRNACVELQDEGGASVGQFCFVACDADPDNQCPQGYGCQEIDIDGDIRPVCVRQCDRDPV